MTSHRGLLRRLLLNAAVLSLVFAFTDFRVRASATGLVVSQLYGAGGNSGALYNADYIEIFNAGSQPATLAGLSLQYASATGTGNFGASNTQMTVLPDVVLAPGQYYLVKEAGGAAGAALPAPDYAPTTTINMSSSAGKVALVNSITSLGCNGGSTPCGPAQLALIVDLVGYGGANFYEGAGPTPALSTITAAMRAGAGCTDTDNNAADFTAVTPLPRTTASPAQPCEAPPSTNPTGLGAAAPSSVVPGGVSLLTVAVTPGGNPASTGLSVTVELTAIGGAAAQAFYDDGSNGDVTPGDNTFSYQATVAASTSLGAKSLPATVSDAQGRSGAASIALTVEQAPTIALIHDIQGSRDISPLVGQRVQTTGIVTAVKADGFFIQSADADADADPWTSEGVFVYTGTPTPAAAVRGNAVRVVGTVQEYYTMTEIAGSPAVTVLGTSALPTPVVISPNLFVVLPALAELEQLEGMRVTVDSLTAVGPSGASGVFYGVVTGLARPFREPGIDVSAEPLPGLPPGVWHFDGNPERLRVDSAALGAPALQVTSGVVVTNLAGVLDYAYGSYTIDPETTPSVTANASAVPLPPASAGQFTVASFNLLHFFNTADQAFADRLNKASLAIRGVLGTPDIVGVQEVDALGTLQALAAKINADAGAASPGYTAYLVEGNDPGGIDVGFLVKSSVTVSAVTQAGKETTFLDPRDGSTDLLNDRPPLVLRGSLPNPGGSAFPVTVVVNHLRSLLDVDANTPAGVFARAKRRAQAEYLATLLQGYQANGEHVISVGDYNAFQFNDGYVDVIGTVRGAPTAADYLLLASADLVDPNLTDLLDVAAPADRYSYVEYGNAQALDHVLVSQDMMPWVASFTYARVNADFPSVYSADANRPEGVSDHDPAVAYFNLPLAPAVAPAITSPNTTLFTVGAAGSFTVTATGYPQPTLSVTGTLPNGVTFNPATGVLSGTPAEGTGGGWSLTFTASNGVEPAAQQIFHLEVGKPPVFSSANATTFTAGARQYFNVRAIGYPQPEFSVTGVLPPGVNFYDVHCCSEARIDGIPTAVGVYPFTIVADNGIGPAVTQTFTLTVQARVRALLPAADFDGDHVADLAVYRPAESKLYVKYSAGGQSTKATPVAPDEVPVPADYDGDGKTDHALYGPSVAGWQIWYSGSGSKGVIWGLPGDLPVPADYDGDGKADVAVFRPSQGAWYIIKSSGGGVGLAWGTAGDVPVPADYDGDGKADIAVFRPSDGGWYIARSSGGAVGLPWGAAGDVPQMGDYDGDGKADVAVFRPSEGAWYIVKSGTGTAVGYRWGTIGDVPVYGDFDGDGKADLAVFRQADGGWYIRGSVGTSTAFAWGAAGDLPM